MTEESPEAPEPPSRDLRIPNKRGLHARASAKFVHCVEKYEAEVLVSKDFHTVGGTSIMGLMMLAAGLGSTIHVEARGPEAEDVLTALTELVESGFGEAD